VEVAATATTAANLDIFRAIAPRPDPAVAAAAATPFSATNVVVMVISPAIAPTKWHRQLLHSLLMAALERFFFFFISMFYKRAFPLSEIHQNRGCLSFFIPLSRYVCFRSCSLSIRSHIVSRNLGSCSHSLGRKLRYVPPNVTSIVIITRISLFVYVETVFRRVAIWRQSDIP